MTLALSPVCTGIAVPVCLHLNHLKYISNHLLAVSHYNHYMLIYMYIVLNLHDLGLFSACRRTKERVKGNKDH